MMISLSILDYEPVLSQKNKESKKFKAINIIHQLVKTGKIYRLHIDVMRPLMIPGRFSFSIEVIDKIYKIFHNEIPFAMHLMTSNPFLFLEKFLINDRKKDMLFILQRESFETEEDTTKALNRIKNFGYQTGICLNLTTSIVFLTEKIIESTGIILLMTVPMGRGGQRYNQEATERIRYFSTNFPDKLIMVDGGINSRTVKIAKRAGAKVVVVGSYLTRNTNPVKSLIRLEKEQIENLT